MYNYGLHEKLIYIRCGPYTILVVTDRSINSLPYGPQCHELFVLYKLRRSYFPKPEVIRAMRRISWE